MAQTSSWSPRDLRSTAKKIRQGLQLERRMRALRVVQEEAGEGLAVWLQHRDELFAAQIGAEGALETDCEADTDEGQPSHEAHVRGVDPRRDVHLEVLAVVTELPAVGCAGSHLAPAYARVR